MSIYINKKLFSDIVSQDDFSFSYFSFSLRKDWSDLTAQYILIRVFCGPRRPSDNKRLGEVFCSNRLFLLTEKKNGENSGEINCTPFFCVSFTAVRPIACARQDRLHRYCHTWPTKMKSCGEPDSSEMEKGTFTQSGCSPTSCNAILQESYTGRMKLGAECAKATVSVKDISSYFLSP